MGLQRVALGPTSCYPASESTMTPPPTPSRSVANGISQQPSTPYHQQQPMSAAHPIYSPIYFPVQANVSASLCTECSIDLNWNSDAFCSNGWYLHHTSRANTIAPSSKYWSEEFSGCSSSSSVNTSILLHDILFSNWYSTSWWAIHQWSRSLPCLLLSSTCSFLACLCSTRVYVSDGTCLSNEQWYFYDNRILMK